MRFISPRSLFVFHMLAFMSSNGAARGARRSALSLARSPCCPLHPLLPPPPHAFCRSHRRRILPSLPRCAARTSGPWWCPPPSWRGCGGGTRALRWAAATSSWRGACWTSGGRATKPVRALGGRAVGGMTTSELAGRAARCAAGHPCGSGWLGTWPAARRGGWQRYRRPGMPTLHACAGAAPAPSPARITPACCMPTPRPAAARTLLREREGRLAALNLKAMALPPGEHPWCRLG